MSDLTEEEIAFLDYEGVSSHEMRGMKILRNAFEFEPVENHAGLGATIAERLVGRGLAEKGETERRLGCLEPRREAPDLPEAEAEACHVTTSPQGIAASPKITPIAPA